jgi:hypothetical protein
MFAIGTIGGLDVIHGRPLPVGDLELQVLRHPICARRLGARSAITRVARAVATITPTADACWRIEAR